jgi:hypothetical protein
MEKIQKRYEANENFAPKATTNKHHSIQRKRITKPSTQNKENQIMMLLKHGLVLGVLVAETGAFAPSAKPSFLPNVPSANPLISLRLYVEDDSFAAPPGELTS